MERITNLKASSQELSGFGIRRCCVNGGPLRRKLIPSLKAPVCISFRDRLADFLGTDVFKEALANDLVEKLEPK